MHFLHCRLDSRGLHACRFPRVWRQLHALLRHHHADQRLSERIARQGASIFRLSIANRQCFRSRRSSASPISTSWFSTWWIISCTRQLERATSSSLRSRTPDTCMSDRSSSPWDCTEIRLEELEMKVNESRLIADHPGQFDHQNAALRAAWLFLLPGKDWRIRWIMKMNENCNLKWEARWRVLHSCTAMSG